MRVMLLVSCIHIGLLFVYGHPEWKPIVVAYLGLLLLGGCFISVGLFISSLTKNQIVAGMVTFAVFLMLWIITWIGSFAGPTVDKLTQYLSIIDTSMTSRRASSTRRTWSTTSASSRLDCS